MASPIFQQSGKPSLHPPARTSAYSVTFFEGLVVPEGDPRTFSKYFFNILADFKPSEAGLDMAIVQQPTIPDHGPTFDELMFAVDGRPRILAGAPIENRKANRPARRNQI
jgi:hypothetical protein